ncbi:hypothetical protein ACWDSJ_05985 [Nocardia sp. NPDC003482]
MGDENPDLGQVLSGYGSMENGGKRLVLPDGQGNMLAGMVADILALIKDIRTDANNNHLSSPYDLSSLPQSKLLTQKFARRGKELDDILSNQEKALTDLGKAFVLVDKTYKGTDGDSADRFKGFVDKGSASKYHIDPKKFKYGPLDIDKGRNWQDPYLGDNPHNKDLKVEDKYLDKPPNSDQISQYRQQGFQPDAVAISPEPGMSIGWKDEMRGFATSAYDAAPKNMFIAWTWCRLSTELTRAFGDLSSQMSALSKSWEGTGKEAAEAATTNYAASTQPLTQYMDAVGKTLSWACGQLGTAAQKVQSAVNNVDPAHPSSNGDTLDKVNDDTARAVAASIMDSLYSPTLTTAASSMFSLPDPTKPLKALPPGGDPRKTGDPTGNPTGSNPPGGHPTGSSPTGSSPTGSSPTGSHPTGSPTAQNTAAAQQQQRKLEEQQQKAQEKYQKELEQQQKAALEQQRKEQAQQVAANKAQQEAQAKAQQQAERAAQQQQAQQTMSQVQQALSQGMSAAQQALQQGMQAAQQAFSQAQQEEAKRAATAGLSSLAGLPEDALEAAKNAAGGGGGGLGKGGGGAGGGVGGLGTPKPQEVLQASRLFPRAAVAADAQGLTAARSGIAAGTGGMGAPGGMGPMGHGAAGQQGAKDRKRADYLDSVEHLDEALGDAPVVAKPVVER